MRPMIHTSRTPPCAPCALRALLASLALLASVVAAVAAAAASPARAGERPTEWELLDTEGGITLYKGPDDGKGTLPFRAVATIDVPLRTVVMVMVDAGRKPEWSPKLASVTIIRTVSPTAYVFQERYAPPWPADDRLFNLRGTVTSTGTGRIVFAAENANDGSLDIDGCITCDVRFLEVAVREVSARRCEVEFTFLGHLGGFIPDWLNNILQKKWPRKFLRGLARQCLKPDLAPTAELRTLEGVFPWLAAPASPSGTAAPAGPTRTAAPRR